MARAAAGTIFEKPEGSGRFYARFTTTRGRKTIRLVTCTTQEQASHRKEFVATELERLRNGGQEAHADKLLELAAVADETRLGRIRKGVDAILAGEAKPVEPSTPLTDAAPSFREFAEEWTSGRLHLRFPDHVKHKKTAQEDIYRLRAHIYPVIGDSPITLVGLEAAERVMRELDSALSVGSRRQVAQLIHRVLSLAAYPARLIEKSPIPEGFLPKPNASKAQAWLYPAEEATLLACREVPLLYRLLYGVLAREGMRRDEALSLAWSNVDLERGTVTLAENKTDDPRAWVLGVDVVRALRLWREHQAWEGRQIALVFSHASQALDGSHLAAALRVHLARAGGARPELFESTDRRTPMRAHDLRATFVTLALASEKTETWVCDRTGHRSSQMLNRYRRSARQATELGLGWLAPLDTAIPDLTPRGEGASTSGVAVSSSGADAGDATLRPSELPKGGYPLEVACARGRLITGLTDAARELMILGDVATARVALAALAELAKEAPLQKAVSACSKDETDVPELALRTFRKAR